MSNHFSALCKTLLPLAAAGLLVSPSSAFAAKGSKVQEKGKFAGEVVRDVSPPLRDMANPAAKKTSTEALEMGTDGVMDVRPERDGPRGPAPGRDVDRALQRGADQSTETQSASASSAVTPPISNFEGLSNQDNFNVFGFRVNPPDPVGDVGKNQYVEMINLVFGVFDKNGNVLLPATALGALWDGFPVTDCAESSGDPIVVYDQFKNRWILSQFTTAGPEFFNCVAISQTEDATGAYYRYAFSTGPNFPDYPKYGVWKDSYVITTREFGPTVEYGIGIYALELNKMLSGQPARVVSFFLEGQDSAGNVDPVVLPLIGDGLLPADIDGNTKPKSNATIPIVGTQDDGAFYGATFDAVNIFELDVKWKANPEASLVLATQLPVASFDSIFPCAPTSRDCLPQPGIVNPAQFLDILSYRQRPTWRLAYRSFKNYESMVTSQSVEASPGIAGMRWYEIRRNNGSYSIHQQGTYSPDSVHRWMGSIAQDREGNMALGYSVVDGVSVFPGIRYTGRMAGDPLGVMTLPETTIIAGTGVQTTTNSRWGDYTSMNIDPRDDCTFWYVNEYYTAAGQASSAAGWQTRIASFKMPTCEIGHGDD